MRVLLALFALLASGVVKSQEMPHSELGLQLKSIIPSSFEITPMYDMEEFPYVVATNGISYGLQISYSRNFNAQWGMKVLLDGSLYSTGLSLLLPQDEDPDPNDIGFGVYDFYDSLEGSRLSTSVGAYYSIDLKWFRLKPMLGLNVSSHVWEILELAHNVRLTNPPARIEVFKVFIGRSQKFNLNPIAGLNASIRLSKLLNIELGMMYVHDRSESLFGTYIAQALSGEYDGLLSNTEERMEFSVGVSFNLPRGSN